MTGLPDAAAWTTARELIAQQTGLFADDRTRTLHVTDIHLVERPEAGYSTVIGSYPLSGTR